MNPIERARVKHFGVSRAWFRLLSDGGKARKQAHLMTARHFPKPKDWQQFERSIWALARDEFDPHAEINGRAGQLQAGVDVSAIDFNGRRVGIQCKKHWDAKVTEKELRAQFARARSFDPPIDIFILATTAGRDRAIQQVARKLTAAAASTRRPVKVQVWGWEDIEERAALYPAATRAFDPDHTPVLEQIITDTMARANAAHQRDACAPRRPSHDAALLRRFRDIATQQRRDFLWQSDFRGGTRSSQLEPFNAMAETWFGLEYEFDDVEVQAAFAPMMQAMARFNELAGNTLFSHESVPGVLTPQTAEDRRNRARTESTRAAVAKLRASAGELYELMETFLRLARQRIGF